MLPIEDEDRETSDLWADFLTLPAHTQGWFLLFRGHKIDRTLASCSCGNRISENLHEGEHHSCCFSAILTAQETSPASPYQRRHAVC